MTENSRSRRGPDWAIKVTKGENLKTYLLNSFPF